MIINLRVDYKAVDIGTMENVSKEMDEIFYKLQDKYGILEYVEISTCNRNEYYIHNDVCQCDDSLLDIDNENITVEFGDEAIIHLFRMTSGLESMIVGEDQILGQVKDSRNKAIKENHCGKVLDTIFTKAIHVGQVVRNKTKINRGFVSIGSAAVDLAEKYLGDLTNKTVLVIGAGKMGSLVAKSLAEKNLKAIFVANRTYYGAVRLAKELGGEAILLDDLNNYFANADVIISATGAPHPIINKKRIENAVSTSYQNMIMIDIANPRDIDEDVEELGIKLFNIDDLREIAELNKKSRENEAIEAEKIIDYEFNLLKESFKIMEIDGIMADLRLSMEEIRQRETQKAIVKMADIDGSVKILDNLTRSIVNKIFYDISNNLKEASKNSEEDVLSVAEYIFKR